jgi:hemerythrin-like domain-containing protein
MATLNAIDLLKEDHDRLKDLFEKLEDTTERASKKRILLFEKIRQEIRIHSQIEEEIFYPAFQRAAEEQEDRELIFEAKEEHRVVDFELPRLGRTKAESEQFGAKAKVLKELFTHHSDEEEDDMFPRAKKLMKSEELESLGKAMKARQRELRK